jgi:hypothetical protein
MVRALWQVLARQLTLDAMNRRRTDPHVLCIASQAHIASVNELGIVSTRMATDRRKSTRPQSNDRRKSRRYPVNQSCWIEIGSGLPPLECRIISMSKSGATIVCENPAELPDGSTLYLTPNGYIARKCRIVWRDELQAGLHFMGWVSPKVRWSESGTDTPAVVA